MGLCSCIFPPDEKQRTLQCILGKRGNPRLIVDGHTFYKKSTYKGKSFWYCKNSRTSYKCPAVAWTLHGNIVKWPHSHSHPVMPEFFNPEEDTEVPIDQIQEVLWQTSLTGGLIFLRSRKGYPVLIHNGHIYSFSHKQDDTRCIWSCVKHRTLSCSGRVITANGPLLLSYSGHNHPQLNDVIKRLQASSCSPSPELP